MSVHAGRGASDWADLEVGDGMIDDFEVGFEVGVGDLLEEDAELVLDFLGLVEEVELVLVLFREKGVDELLELLGPSLEGQLVDS